MSIEFRPARVNFLDARPLLLTVVRRQYEARQIRQFVTLFRTFDFLAPRDANVLDVRIVGHAGAAAHCDNGQQDGFILYFGSQDTAGRAGGGRHFISCRPASQVRRRWYG